VGEKKFEKCEKKIQIGINFREDNNIEKNRIRIYKKRYGECAEKI
jgi:hypothetical protein